jgi:hypothetical protein
VNADRLGDHELPIVGAPPLEITFPVAGSMICASDCTEPSAYWTPDTAFTVGRMLSGTGLSSCPPPPPPLPPSVGLKA